MDNDSNASASNTTINAPLLPIPSVPAPPQITPLPPPINTEMPPPLFPIMQPPLSPMRIIPTPIHMTPPPIPMNNNTNENNDPVPFNSLESFFAAQTILPTTPFLPPPLIRHRRLMRRMPIRAFPIPIRTTPIMPFFNEITEEPDDINNDDSNEENENNEENKDNEDNEDNKDNEDNEENEENEDEDNENQNGYDADIAVWDITQPAELCYQFGVNPLKYLIKQGDIVHENEQ